MRVQGNRLISAWKSRACQAHASLDKALMGSDTTGQAVCNQVRTFDLQARMLAGSARYIEGGFKYEVQL